MTNMEATTTRKLRTLVAVDWKDEDLQIDRVVSVVGEAFVSHSCADEQSNARGAQEGETKVVHRLTFDARLVRDTEVSGAAFHSGFVSWVEVA